MDKSNIIDILNKARVETIYHSHVSLLNPKGKYQLSRKELDNFWYEYSKIDNKKYKLGIAEKSQHYLPILVDIDIKKEYKNNNKKIYKHKHIIDVIQTYQSIIRNILSDCKGEHLICVLLEKPFYLIKKDNKTYIKNGFHLHFPYTFINKIAHEIHLVPKVLESLNEQKVFEDIGFPDTKKVLDKSYIKIPWLLYGSQKDSSNEKCGGTYKIAKIYDEHCEEISINDAFKNYKIYNKDEKLIKFTKSIEYYLPQILSIIPYGRKVAEIHPNILSPIQNKIVNNNPGKFHRMLNLKEALEIAEKLLEMVADHRAEDFNEWMNIGWTLYNIGNGCQKALELWMNFSQRCQEKFDKSICMTEWSKMVCKDLTIGTLKYIARQDSPEIYKKYIEDNIKDRLKTSLSGAHNDIAKMLYERYSEEFVCASINYKIWYHYKDHRWKEIESGVDLRSKISSEIVNYFVELGTSLLKKLGAAVDEGEKAMYNARLIQSQRLIMQLKSAPYKNNVLKEAMEVFYDERFEKKLDSNSYLIGFNNGIYDLKKNLFRPGIPEDFISMKMNVDYDETLTKKDIEVQEVYDFLEKIFPDKNVRRYFLDTSSDVFVGGNSRKIVQVWSGEGDNGKSVTESIFEKMLGEYAVKLPTALITGKRTQASNACPELVRAGNGVRWAVLQEPDQKDVINVGILKELSGNDTFFARDLHKSGGEITPMFKLILVCNEPPKVPYNDKATWNRIRVIPFESTFCDDAPEEYEEQLRQKKFKKDSSFADKIPSLIKAFAWVLINHRKYCINCIEPDKVKLATAAYRKKNDVYRQYIEESITENNDSQVSLTELYANFKEWFRTSLPGHSIPIKNDVKEYFIKLWGQPDKGIVWKGYKFCLISEDLVNGDAIKMEENDFKNYDNHPLLH